MTGHVLSGGVVVSTLQSSYSVEPTVDGSRLHADFEFLGRTFAWRLAIAVSGYFLERRQGKTFRDYVEAIETEYDASRAASRSGAAKTVPPSRSVPPS